MLNNCANDIKGRVIFGNPIQPRESGLFLPFGAKRRDEIPPMLAEL